MLRLPTPPTPIPAMFSLSLGAVWPKAFPITDPGTIEIAAPKVADVLMKPLRVSLSLMILRKFGSLIMFDFIFIKKYLQYSSAKISVICGKEISRRFR
jgi:hypothetical protein